MASAGWRLPVRSGTPPSPSMKAPSALASATTAASCIDTSTSWPFPVRSRCSSALMMPPKRCTAARKSHTARPGLDGRQVRKARGVHDAAHRLDGEVHGGQVAIGAAQAEALAGAVDEAGILRVEHLPAEAQAIHDAGGEVLHHDVGLARQPEEQRLALRLLEVEDHRLLVGVEHHERVGLDVALAAADDVALGRLDLEDAGAHEAEEKAAVRAVVDLAEVEHEHAFERAAGGPGHECQSVRCAARPRARHGSGPAICRAVTS